MEIELIDDQQYLQSEEKQVILDLIQLTADHLGLNHQDEVDVSIVSNDEIQQLNREYRQIDRPTDVLSFALEEVSDEFDLNLSHLLDEEMEVIRHLGDIIISYPRAQEQADDYNHSLKRELGFLAVHGFLHLNGYDHQNPEQEEEMFSLQEKILSDYGLVR
ncbi:rRNA maturation RNase YbeY [Hutsoniella sourekii]|uniref:rRNA maturation RNase YbeY n=1 Tax=Hutsoniella sourekii TaxID=87650 RepID=UPI000485B1BE|nr:rRNA maturation RNase YbeY [Hutsoniella sourekii]